MGACVAGGAYLPIMSDETLMVEGNGSIFRLSLPGKSGHREDTDAETLARSYYSYRAIGIADYKFRPNRNAWTR